MEKFCSNMTPEFHSVIILVIWSKFIFQKCDVTKIIIPKVYKLFLKSAFLQSNLKSMGISSFTKFIKITTSFNKKY